MIYSVCKRAALSLAALFLSVNVSAVDITAQVQQCSSCHGVDGRSSNDLWPNLAGQKAGYIASKVRAIRDGERIVPTMMPFVQALSDEQIDAVAKHFASKKRAKAIGSKKELPGAHVRARCVSCHGMQGITVNQLWPNLAGQKAGYLLKQLRDFRSGQRKHPIMEVIAGELNDEQSKQVAEYYSLQ
ncbi:c-type cytochrome [uncultured Pseudoteredinibacter sp.]|uniref:c-type cytochrome n=1 Tax=uncultured Pseudoteredinibacter sp. TaxID=1641701 RepID=UPI00262A1104|nr:c-type cytochrome [uncultured Pseudoteredinibacter sp.]